MRTDLVGWVYFLVQIIFLVRIFYRSASPLCACICHLVMLLRLLISLHTWKYLVQARQLWRVAFQKVFSSMFLSDQWRDCGSCSLIFTHSLVDCQSMFSGSAFCCIYYVVESAFSLCISSRVRKAFFDLCSSSSLHVRDTVGLVMQNESVQVWTWREKAPKYLANP